MGKWGNEGRINGRKEKWRKEGKKEDPVIFIIHQSSYFQFLKATANLNALASLKVRLLLLTF